MIEVFDTTAARIALARRMLGCPGCDQPLRLWGHARERTVRDTGGTPLTIRPDRALCTGCGVTHVVLDAGLLPRRAYAAGLIGQALAASARGHGRPPPPAPPDPRQTPQMPPVAMAAMAPNGKHQRPGNHMAGSRCRDVENSRAGGLTASRRPCDTAAATSHGGTPAIAVPSSRRTAAAASPIAATASATAPRPEVITGGEAST